MSLNVHNLKAQFARNRAKTAVLAILGAALFVLVGRALFATGPRSATAIALTANPQDFPIQPPASDPIVEAEMISRLEQSKILWSVLHEQGGLSPAQTFLFDPTYYALDPAHRTLSVDKPPTTIEKPPIAVPTPAVAATTLRSAKELLARLQLQSTIMTASPIAVINGQIVRVGEPIGDFRVTAIKPREVTLTLDGNPFVLQMTQPERDKPSSGRPF